MWQKDGINMQRYPIVTIDTMRALLLQILGQQTGWIKVHAAEFLLWTGNNQRDVYEAFVIEEKNHGRKMPYCVGIWRVLAQAADDERERQYWKHNIIQTFLDAGSPGRVHAVESLAKLGVSVLDHSPQSNITAENNNDKVLALCTRWSNAFFDQVSREVSRDYFFRVAAFESEVRDIRTLSSFILRQLSPLPVDQWWQITKIAYNTPDITLMISLLSTAVVLVPAELEKEKPFNECLVKLREHAHLMSKAVRTDICYALAEKGKLDDIAVLMAMICQQKPIGNAHDDTDIQATAAYAIIRIQKRYNERQVEF